MGQSKSKEGKKSTTKTLSLSILLYFIFGQMPFKMASFISPSIFVLVTWTMLFGHGIVQAHYIGGVPHVHRHVRQPGRPQVNNNNNNNNNIGSVHDLAFPDHFDSEY